MKKLIIILLMGLTLSGCTVNANSDDVFELLSSPKLSENEAEIVDAITLFNSSEVVLKYLKEGDNISPIQYIDINDDLTEEVIAFYSSPSSSGYIRMAVLEERDGVWKVIDDFEGFGSEVLNVSLIQFDKSKGNQLLVTYTFSNTTEKIVTMYFHENGVFTNAYNQLCQSYIVSDVTKDGNDDLIIGQPNLEDRLPSINLVSLNEEKEIGILAQYTLNVVNANIQSIKLSKSTKSETPAIIIDYKDNQNIIYTEAISYQDEEFINVLENSIVQKIWNYDYELVSKDIDGDNYLETSTIIVAPEEEKLDYMEWTNFLIEPAQRKMFGVIDGKNQIFVQLPDEWQGYTKLNQISGVEWSVLRYENENTQEDIEEENYVDISDLDELVKIRIIHPGTAFYINANEEIFEVGVLRIAISFNEDVSEEQREIISKNIMYLD